MEILLSGHRTCYNRGCEAIVRTTAQRLARRWPEARLHLPTLTPEYDDCILADAALPIHTHHLAPPPTARLLRRLQGRHGLLTRAIWPAPVPWRWRRALRGIDAVLAVGGDNYTLDYGIPAHIVGLDACALRLGRPVVLWGASVGPFDERPAWSGAIHRLLGRFAGVGARETLTEQALAAAGLDNVIPVLDPAFDLEPEPFFSPDLEDFLQGSERVIGLNLSPIVASRAGPGFLDEAARLVQRLVADPGTRVILIPHVVRHREPERDDPATLADLLDHANLDAPARARIFLLPSSLRAGQYKSVVGRCRALVAARTHLTIAGFSRGIPTIALGYSRKAAGLDRDLYGGRGLHLAADAFSAAAVEALLERAEVGATALAEQSAAAQQARRSGAEALLDRLRAAL